MVDCSTESKICDPEEFTAKSKRTKAELKQEIFNLRVMNSVTGSGRRECSAKKPVKPYA